MSECEAEQENPIPLPACRFLRRIRLHSDGSGIGDSCEVNMGEGYTKLFSDIVDSSIWDEDAKICKVWVTLLALSNAAGFVRGSLPWLANKSKVGVDECRQALTKFESPDPLSRTTSNDGRRIQTTDTGWIILNHGLFRSRHGLSDDPRKVYQREWVQKKRASKPTTVESTESTESTPASASVTEKSTKKEEVLREFSDKLKTGRMMNVWQRWMTHRRSYKKPGNWLVLFNEQIDFLEGFSEEQAFSVLQYSLMNGYQGLFEPKTQQSGPHKPTQDSIQMKTLREIERSIGKL